MNSNPNGDINFSVLEIYLSIYQSMMTNKWNSGYTKNTNNGFSSEYFIFIH